jgi:hypothetical protein
LTASGGSLGSGAEYEWGTGATVGSNLLATTSGSTYSVSPSAATTYWVRLKGTAACSVTATGGATTSVGVYAAFSAGAITTGSTTTNAGTNPNVTITSTTSATGGSGNVTYQWRRTGTSSATLTGSNATYAINTDAANYSTAGTYYITRYAKDNTCNTAWVQSSNTYTLYVKSSGPSGTVTYTACTQCCYNGSAWVDCYVTTNAYPFESTNNTSVVWSGNGNTYYSGANSDKDGRSNTNAISSTGTSAVQLCKNLGTGWYLPAYEELVNMSAGSNSSYPPLNGLSGANLLATPSNYYWSSTELYNNGGRMSNSDTDYQGGAVRVNTDGSLGSSYKTLYFYVRCAWRN